MKLNKFVIFPRPSMIFDHMLVLLDSYIIPELEEHSISAVCNSLFTIFPAALHV
jgi:hypothetical protein